MPQLRALAFLMLFCSGTEISPGFWGSGSRRHPADPTIDIAPACDCSTITNRASGHGARLYCLQTNARGSSITLASRVR